MCLVPEVLPSSRRGFLNPLQGEPYDVKLLPNEMNQQDQSLKLSPSHVEDEEARGLSGMSLRSS